MATTRKCLGFPVAKCVANHCCCLGLAGLLTACAFLVADASAGPYFSTDNTMPPEQMVSDPGAVVKYYSGILMRNLQITNPTNRVTPNPAGYTVNSFFDVWLEISLDGGGTWTDGLDDDCGGSITSNAAVAGVYPGELTSLNIAGAGMPSGILIRESPTMASSGSTSIQAVSGGYMIDSFFDVYTEIGTDYGGSWSKVTALSLDGGGTWTMGELPLHVQGVPEPGTLVLLLTAGMSLLLFARRRQKAERR